MPDPAQDADRAVRERFSAPEAGRQLDASRQPDASRHADRLEATSPGGDPRGLTGLTGPGRRGGQPAHGRGVLRLQALAGNAAVARLVGEPAAGTGSGRRSGPVLRHAGETDAPGTETETPSPGPGGEIPLDNPATAPAPAAPTSSSTKVGPPSLTSYTVSGTLREAANAVAARPEAGATITTPDMVMPADGKWPTHVQVVVTQVVELPEWDGKAAATQNQRNEWDRFKAAITAHENGHVATDVKAFANAHVKIKAKKTRAEGEAEYDRIVTASDTDNAAFDAGNDHGRSAGTNINPNIDEVTKVP